MRQANNAPRFPKRHTLRFLLLVVAALTLAACHRGDVDALNILRFDKLIFDNPIDKLAPQLDEFKRQYPSPLLNIYPDDPAFMGNLKGFVSDTTVRGIYDITMSRYSDLRWLERELAKSLREAKTLDDEIEVDKMAVYVSAAFDYNNRILVDRDSRSLLVSIDQYALGDMERYSYFGLPMFLVALSDSMYLASDIMAEIARQYIAMPDEDNTMMLDLMIAEGKVLYFLDKTMPDVADRVKIRYSEEQMRWSSKNESNIWAYFIQNNLLYEKDFNRYHNFVDEAPKTNAFKDSAPRTTQYIGWQIVRRYMERNNVSMKELFANSDSQSILQASNYKP